ncbi:MAG: fold metallo-hydrolase [Haloplasmataceae bacterium]|nr:fold metallo-hydrolase [Haloplasmataceae bacterium]
MKVTILASGSKGNATLIETNETKILLDVGLSYKNLVLKLIEINVGINEIDAIFITHEHIDHIKGLDTLIKKNNINIYLSHGTYEAIVTHRKFGVTYEYFNICKSDQMIKINNLDVIPFLISHDALEPFGYVLYEGKKKLVYLTDTGYISQVNEEKIKDADIYIIEANHNIEMLMCTNRPWNLKQRILGNFGHLNNEDTLYTLLRIVNVNTKFIYLAHISEEANNHDLLMLTVNEIFSNYDHYDKIKFFIAKQYETSEISEI